METKELRPFSKVDWYGWAGASRFPDGSEPLIAYTMAAEEDWPEAEDMAEEAKTLPPGEGFALTCIVDASGVAFCGVNGQYDLAVPDRAVAERVARMLLAAPRVSARALVALGFTACNLPDLDALARYRAAIKEEGT